MRLSQEKALLEYLRDNKDITSMEAFTELGITRLSARIYDLRKKGYKLEEKHTKIKNRYGNSCVFSRYVLVG